MYFDQFMQFFFFYNKFGKTFKNDGQMVEFFIHLLTTISSVILNLEFDI